MADFNEAIIAYRDAEHAIECAETFGAQIEEDGREGNLDTLLGQIAIAKSIQALTMRLDYLAHSVAGIAS